MNRQNQFGSYITHLCEEQGIPFEQLYNGLCYPGKIAKIRKGEVIPDKMLQDRMLSRLGEATDDYESFLDYDDYSRWEMRQRILRLLMEQDTECAKEALTEYENGMDMEQVLDRQFCLAMRAQAARQEGVSDEKLQGIFGEALALTVPGIGCRSIQGMLLSIQELNLLLEYEYCLHSKDLRQRYEEILEYIRNARMEQLSRVKIFPKAAALFCRCLLEEEHVLDKEDIQKILSLCKEAIQLLRSECRLYYFWELACIYEEAARQLPGQDADLSQLQDWKEAVGFLYERFHIPKEMHEFCYFYIEKEVYCRNDIIRIRRKMLGLTQQQLGEGICSIMTLNRLENKKIRTQKYNTMKIFERLHLPEEFYRTELITDSKEALLLMDDLRNCINKAEYQKARELIEKIKDLIPMDVVFNRQVMERFQVVLDRKEKQITDEEYAKKLKKILELTLPERAIFSPGEKYFTVQETLCIHNMTFVMDDNICMKYLSILCMPFLSYKEKGILNSFIGAYEVDMNNKASCLGNIGQYELSSQISTELIEESLLNRRVFILATSIYNILWNHHELIDKGYPDEQNEDWYIQLCIQFCQFCGFEYHIPFYQKKEQIWKSKK